MTQLIECDALLSDLVLQAAQAAMPADWFRYYADHGTWLSDASVKQRPVLALLGALLDATTCVAAAVADNAWADSQPLPAEVTAAMADGILTIRNHLITATNCPTAEEAYELPSFTESSALELA